MHDQIFKKHYLPYSWVYLLYRYTLWYWTLSNNLKNIMTIPHLRIRISAIINYITILIVFVLKSSRHVFRHLTMWKIYYQHFQWNYGLASRDFVMLVLFLDWKTQCYFQYANSVISSTFHAKVSRAKFDVGTNSDPSAKLDQKLPQHLKRDRCKNNEVWAISTMILILFRLFMMRYI